MWNVAGRGHVGTEDLPANWVRDKNRNSSTEGGDGREAVGKTARDTLRGHAIVIDLHVQVGRSDAESQVREVQTTLRSATNGVLEALESGKLKVGEIEYPVKMNQTRSHMANEEDCAKGCKRPVVALERKIVQVLMEVLVEEDWIWWNKEKNQVATESGRTTSVLGKGEAILEDGLRVWHPGDDDPNPANVGGANLPIDRGGTGAINGRN